MHTKAFPEPIDSRTTRAHSQATSLEAPLPGVACSNSSRVQKGSLGRPADDFTKCDHRDVLASAAVGVTHPCDLPTGSGEP